MDTGIDQDSLEYIIQELSNVDISTDDGKIIINPYSWRNNEHNLAREDRDDDAYRKHLVNIFGGQRYSTVMNAINKSMLHLNLKLSINQFLNNRAMIHTMSELCSDVRKLLNKSNEEESSESSTDDIKETITNGFSNINDKFSDVDDLLSTIDSNVRDVNDDINTMTRRIKDLESSVGELDKKIQTIDDKFNLLSSFIDLAMEKK